MKSTIRVGIIPDGNRRFAQKKAIELYLAYKLGAKKALEAVDYLKKLGVREISFYGTSSSNLLKRSKVQITALQRGVVYFCNQLANRGVPFHIIGNPDNGVIEEYRTLFGMSTNVAPFIVHIDALGPNNIKDELAPLFVAIKKVGLERVRANPEHFVRSSGIKALDLVIRTGNQSRLSNFLPWQSGNAELYFSDLLWPEFDRVELEKALRWYNSRKRTLGA